MTRPLYYLFSLLPTFIAFPVLAASTFVPACAETGNCQLNDAVNILIAVSTFILGISGTFALLMFVYGGFMWVSSGGSQERITKGKTIVRNAVVGLIIIFVSYGLISFAISSFGLGEGFNLLGGTSDTKYGDKK